MAKSLGNNLLFNILRNITNIIFPLISAPYIARVLSPDDIGLVNFANTYANYFALIALLGIPNYGIREVAKNRDNKGDLSKLFSELFSISIVTTVILSSLYILTIIFVNQLNRDYLVFILAGIVLYCSPLNIDWLFSGLEDFKFLTIRSIIIKTLSILSLFIFVRNENNVLTYILLLSLAACANKLWNIVALHKSGITIRFVFKGYRKHIKPLLVLFSSVLAVSLYTILNTLMLGFLSSYDQVSYYNQANNISRAFLAIVTSMSEIIIPRISYLGKSKDWNTINTLLSKSTSMVSFLSFPIACGIIVLAPLFVPLYLGENFLGSIYPLQIMSIIIIIIGFNNITASQVLLGLGFDYLLLRSVIAGATINLLLNLLLIPSFGAPGAAYSSVIAELTILILSAIYVNKHSPVRVKISIDCIKAFIGTCLFIPLYYLISQLYSGWILLLLYSSTCVIIYFLSQIILKNESLTEIIRFLTKK